MEKINNKLLPPVLLLIIAGLSSCPGSHDSPFDWIKGEKFAITLDANGGIFEGGDTQVTITSSSPRFLGRDYPKPIFPAVDDEDPFLAVDEQIFNGYFRTETGGSRITENSQLVVVSEGFTVYAHWQSKTDAGEDITNFINTFVTPRINSNGNLNEITGDINLFLQGTDLIDIFWESDDPAHLSAAGKVAQPYFYETDATVRLTATITKGSVIKSVDYSVTILKETDYEGIANAAIDAAVASLTLSLGDLSAITRNIKLPEEANDLPVTWKSGNQTWLTDEGVITRPPYTEDNALVILAASITYTYSDEAGLPPLVREHPFNVTIKRLASPGEQDEEDVDETIGNIIDLLGSWDLSAVINDLPLPSTGVRDTLITWVSGNPASLSNSGTVTRQAFDTPSASDVTLTLTANFSKGSATGSQTFTVTVKKEPDPRPVVAAKIRKAEITLGDLSTVGGNVSLPASDSGVSIAWVSSNATVFSNSGTVTRQAVHTELTLRGTFTSVEVPRYSEQKTWNVRVMRTGAAVSEFLNVHLTVVDGVLTNAAYSGNYYQAALIGNAALAQQGDYGYIKLPDTDSYLDLGPKVGSLLRGDQWTIEFYINTPADSGTMFGFANDLVNDNTASWRGTLAFENPAMWFRARTYGNSSSAENDANAIGIGGSMGITAGRCNRWNHLAVAKSGRVIGVFRNGGQATNNNRTGDFSRISTSAQFAAADDETDPLRYSYFGRSPFIHSPNSMPANTQFMEIKIYSRALVAPNGTTYEGISLPGITIANPNVYNTAFGYDPTN